MSETYSICLILNDFEKLQVNWVNVFKKNAIWNVMNFDTLQSTVVEIILNNNQY